MESPKWYHTETRYTGYSPQRYPVQHTCILNETREDVFIKAGDELKGLELKQTDTEVPLDTATSTP